MTAREHLDQLDELREAGTPGEWSAEFSDGERDDVVARAHRFARLIAMDVPQSDAALIVAAVNALPQLTAAIRAVLDKHAPIEWFAEVESGDEVFDLTKPLGAFCHECTENEYVEAVVDGYAIDQGSPVIYWPCPTVDAITEALQ